MLTTHYIDFSAEIIYTEMRWKENKRLDVERKRKKAPFLTERAEENRQWETGLWCKRRLRKVMLKLRQKQTAEQRAEDMKCYRGQGDGREKGRGRWIKLKSQRVERGQLGVNTPCCLCRSLNGSEGFSTPCHALLCWWNGKYRHGRVRRRRRARL